MPLIQSTYRPKGLFKSGHFSTIYSAKLRPKPEVEQHRERVTLPDGDFLDLDFSYSNKPSTKIAILLHGLEGNAQRTYMRGQAKALVEAGWDACAFNFRGCSGETNTRYESYNAGKTEDLEAVITYLLGKDTYDSIGLIGFSLGGNMVLKYLGERRDVPKEIKRAVAISTPLDLKETLEQLEAFHNIIYRSTFLLNLRKKYKQKMNHFPEEMTKAELKQIRSLLDFDNLYTAPAHGFTDASDYYDKSSSGQFLPHISIPVLLLNAENDSFLSEESYPFTLAEKSSSLYFEYAKYGGHVGFHETNARYYSEKRAVSFLKSN
ncbi:YheT family hydrolase [Luteirhabdus pelagi]|uniref:YheT family hydrolase n=1 Tax=Luteirhabdus pelagi TaxID=2792783 RepID=UPI0019395751|nr:alpha/beta fold hydrolase [Luteirhabdus pelagi]